MKKRNPSNESSEISYDSPSLQVVEVVVDLHCHRKRAAVARDAVASSSCHRGWHERLIGNRSGWTQAPIYRITYSVGFDGKDTGVHELVPA